MTFAGQKFTREEIDRHYRVIGAQFSGQVVICDLLMHCHWLEEINPADMAEAHHLRNIANYVLKRLGIIREDNLINMVRHFMGQESVKRWENPEKKEKET